MNCRACAAEIADKAIVCYRCGTPTAAPPASASPPRAAGRFRWVLAVALVVLAAAVAWFVWGR